MAQKIEELENGVVVYQVTDEPRYKNNIYCERSYCSPDSRCFIYQRSVGSYHPQHGSQYGSKYGGRFAAEYVACDFGAWETRVLGRGLSSPEISREGGLYYARPAADGTGELVRVEVATGRSRVIPVDGGVRLGMGLAISPGERFLACGVPISYEPQMFGIERVDLESGKREIIFTDPCICNPHLQFEPLEGEHILVQRNRGCRFAPDGHCISLLGEEGCTLFLLGVKDGKVTPLEVGPPHTASCTGHEDWAGDTKEVLLTVTTAREDQGAWGDLLGVRAGRPARLISKEYAFCQVNASVCGRFFCCNGLKARGDDHFIVIGSARSGKHIVVCNSGPMSEAPFDRVYFSPDLKWVVFNSYRSGALEVYAASIPLEMIEELGKEDQEQEG